MKQNDWIIANVNNPNFEIADFVNLADMTMENTQLLPYNEYLTKDIITENEMFKNKSGQFDADLFKNYYINKANEFQKFSEDDYVDSLEYSMFDTRITRGDKKIKNPNYQLFRMDNPDRQKMGIAGINVISERDKSVSELAQNSNIWDPEKNEFLDYTPNDNALIDDKGIHIFNYVKSLFNDDPLVIAKYEEDTEEIVNGQKVVHKKGTYKLNSDGDYYTEKLNGRSPVGKEFISAMDTITIDGSDVNEYDFFDSDGMDKSVVGSTVKNLVAVSPMLFGGPVGTVYGGLFVARELAKAMPMLADVITLFGDNVDNQFINTMAAWGHKFSGSTSEYAKANMFSYENFANLASDVALQWGQQKTIVKGINNLFNANKKQINAAYAKAANNYANESRRMLAEAFDGKIDLNDAFSYIGTKELSKLSDMISKGHWEKTALGSASLKKYLNPIEKAIEKRTKLGQDLSLVYMAMISNTDVYESVLEKGGTQKEAAAMALGSMAGMFAVDKFFHLGELFFDDAAKPLRQSLAKDAQSLFEKTATSGESTKNLLQKGFALGKKAIENYGKGLREHTLGFAGKALGEGIEEVSEELVADISKSIGELAGEFGLASQSNYGAWDNALQRYAMSFLGGAVGGGMFYGIDAKNSVNKPAEQSTLFLIRNNKTSELLSELEKMHKRGELGSTKLSVDKSEGKYISADEQHESQNDWAYKRIKESIIQMDDIINKNGLKMSENEIFDNLVLSESRYLKLRDYLQGASYLTGYQQEYQNMTEQLVKLQTEETELNDKYSDSEQRKSNDYIRESQSLENRRQSLMDKINQFKSGEHSYHYLKKLLWAIDTKLSAPFISLNYDQWVRHNYGKDVRHLTESEEKTYREQYGIYTKNSKKMALSEAFKLYEEMEKGMIPVVTRLNDQDVLSWGKVAKQIEKSIPKLKTYDDKLDTEDDEQYKLRYRQEGESEEAFALRANDRQLLINEENESKLQQLYQTFISGQGIIDSNAYRRLLSSTKERKKDIKQNIISKLHTLTTANPFNVKPSDNTKLTKEVSQLLMQLTPKNKEVVLKQIKETIFNNIREQVEDINKDLIERTRIIREAWEEVRGDFETSPVTLKQVHEVIAEDIEGQGIYSLEDYNKKAIMPFDQASVESYFDFINLRQSWDEALSSGAMTQEEYDAKNEELRERESEIVATTEEEINRQSQDIAEDFFEQVEINIVKELEQNKWLKTFDEFARKLKTDANPIIQLLKVTNPNLGNIKDLESQLVEIWDTYENLDSTSDFELTEPQIETLKAAVEQMNIIRAFLYSASKIPSLAKPVGHNRALNEFARNHSDIIKNVEELPELTDDIANVYLYELDRYTQEIRKWEQKALENAANKEQEYIQADDALLKTRIDFYKSNQFKLKDGTNLAEGILFNEEEITLQDLINADSILYSNFQKALKAGHTEEDIISDLLDNVTVVGNIQQQIVSPINRNLNYGTYTDYDKFTQLISVLASPTVDFYIKQKEYAGTTKKGNKIIPITTQEYAERVLDAALQNTSLINKALDLVNAKTLKPLPVLKNTAILTGVGGAGKTDIVVRTVLHDYKPEELWLSGPTDSQINSLQDIFKNSKGFNRTELLEQFISKEDLNYILDAVKNGKVPTKFFDRVEGLDGTITYKLKDSLNIKSDIKDLPKVLVIDEATHFSNAELQILSKAAEKYGFNILLVGDENQKGFSGLGYNFDREVMLAWRAPRLGVSLRDSTYQKIKNLTQVTSILDKLRTEVLTDDQYNDILNNQISNIDFKYYLQDNKFSGEMITDKLTPQAIQALDGTIGYVGPKDAIYDQLVNAGKNVQILSPDNIQGAEFKYTIINKDWKIPEEGKPGIKALEFLQDLYTMMSRSEEGTIFIDNGLSDIINNTKESIYAKAKTPSLEYFTKLKGEQLEGLVLEPIKEEEVAEKAEEESSEEIPDETVSVNQAEVNEEQQEESRMVYAQSNNINWPIRVYGDVSLLGVSREKVLIGGKEKYQWENKDDSRTDIGIFLRAGEQITDGKEKKKYVQELRNLKSLLLYGTDLFSRATTINRMFTKEALDNAEYYVRVSDEDSLVGATGMSTDSLKISGKILTVVAKIKDKEGNINTITLGGLANPDKWEANKNKIISAILGLETISEDQQKYVDNFDSIILSYRNKIAELVSTNQEYRIQAPKFTQMTELIFNDKDGNRLPNMRLEEINSDKRPWDSANQGAIVSKNHILTQDIPGSNLKKGTTVRYVTRHTLLNPDELEDLYWEQKNNPGTTPLVRLQVLKNEGVSFRSLYQKRYKDLYTHNIKGNVITFPIHLFYQSTRMYSSIWNFRADLIRFNKRLQDWKKREGITDLDALIKMDQEAYDRFAAEYRRTHPDAKYVPEEEYRNHDFENKDLVKKIWEFNDSLADGVKQFRLGYSSKNGVYLRKLTNIKADNIFYEGDTNPIGIYINPEIAEDYLTFLNLLFDKFLNKIISNPSNAEDLINPKFNTGWFNEVKADGETSFKVYDDNNIEKSITLKIPNGETAKALPVLLTQMAKFMQYYSEGKAGFEEHYIGSDEHEGMFRILLNGEEIDYLSIIRPLNIQETEDGVHNLRPGIHLFTNEDGTEQTMDFRINNLWDLMFHGSIETASQNKFDGDEIRATAAYFKDGIHNEPITYEYSEDRKIAMVAASDKLYSTDTNIGFPLFYVNLDKYDPSAEEGSEGPSEEPAGEEQTDLEIFNNKLQTLVGISLTPKALATYTNTNDIIATINDQLKEQLQNKFKNSDIEDIATFPVGIMLESGDIKVLYLKEMLGISDNIISQKWSDDNTNIIITTDKGTYKYYMDDFGEIKPAKLIATNSVDTNTAQDILTGILDNLKDKDIDDIEMVSDFIKATFQSAIGTDLSISSKEGVTTAINNIQNSQYFKDVDNSDDYADYRTFLEYLTSIKNNYCTKA